MAGRGKPQTPGRRALKLQSDRLLRGASALDAIEAGAGEGLRLAGAEALKAVVDAAIRQSANRNGSEANARSY